MTHLQPYRCIELASKRLAIVPDYAASRAIAREIEAREREAARRAARPAIVKLLDLIAPSVAARLERRAA